jgi:hypothetical protein
MAKILLIALAFLISSVCLAQPVKFKAFQACYFMNDNLKANWEDRDILIVFDGDKMKLVIYAKDEQHLDLIGVDVEEKKNKDTYLTYTAVDNDGVKLTAMFKLFKDDSRMHVGNLYLIYDKYTIAYRLKRND